LKLKNLGVNEDLIIPIYQSYKLKLNPMFGRARKKGLFCSAEGFAEYMCLLWQQLTLH
jgi:hypothetical protein